MHEDQQLKKVLVVGDWVVDDYWVTDVHRSRTASRTGPRHIRAQHSPQSSVLSFCGAGRPAALLRRNQSSGQPLFDVFGLGLWADGDTDLLTQMFDREGGAGLTPFSLTHLSGKSHPERVKLVNLAPALTENASYATTRVIRVYRYTGTKIIQLGRIDWELSPPLDKHKKRYWINDTTRLQSSNLDLPDDVDAIVIKDLGKGVVSPVLLKWLAGRYLESQWFVSSKTWPPAWLTELEEVDLRLYLIPQIAARIATSKEGDPPELTRWLTPSSHPSQEALSQLADLATRFRASSDLTVAVLPGGFQVLAVHRSQARTKPLFSSQPIHEPRRNPQPIPISMASVFFGTLVANMLGGATTDLAQLLATSLTSTLRWQNAEVERFQDPRNWRGHDLPPKDLNSASSTTLVCTPPADLETARSLWESALQDTGDIPGTQHRRLELWRAMTDVDGYICCDSSKRRALADLVRELEDFKLQPEVAALSCLLVADPGSGKTYLASCLAETLGLRFLPFDITQMFTPDDILDCFDTIGTTYSQRPHEPLLVFIDEVNSKIQNQHVYSSFLAPLEKGVYVRGGKTFQMPAAAWIFAGTEDVGEISGHQKGKDLISRLSLGQVNLRSHGGSLHKVENVYLGAFLILKTFPDVRFVSNQVLSVFADLGDDVRVRDLRRFVQGFKYIQGNSVLVENMVTDTKNVGLSPSELKRIGKKKETPIEIVLS